MLDVGDLVQVLYKDDGWGKEKRWILATVIDYRPEQYGGSSVRSWLGEDGVWLSEVVHEPKRGEVLVISTEIDLCSWFDESNIRLVPKS